MVNAQADAQPSKAGNIATLWAHYMNRMPGPAPATTRFTLSGGDSILTAGTDGQLLATLGSVADNDNPAASQRCTNAGGVASVDKRSA